MRDRRDKRRLIPFPNLNALLSGALNVLLRPRSVHPPDIPACLREDVGLPPVDRPKAKRHWSEFGPL